MRYTLSYLLLGDGDAVLIDPGWDSDAGLEHLAAPACGRPAWA